MTLIETLFYKSDENTNQMRISKTKVITCIVFIIFFIISITFYSDPNYKDTSIIVLLFSSILFGLIFAVPTFIVGWLIGKLLNRNKAKSYSNNNTNNQTINNNKMISENIEEKESTHSYAKEFKNAVEIDNVDLASEILTKWDKNDANYKYASLIYEGMPPSQLNITEMNQMLKTADNMKAYDETLKEWYRTTAIEVINLNKEE